MNGHIAMDYSKDQKLYEVITAACNNALDKNQVLEEVRGLIRESNARLMDEISKLKSLVTALIDSKTSKKGTRTPGGQPKEVKTEEEKAVNTKKTYFAYLLKTDMTFLRKVVMDREYEMNRVEFMPVLPDENLPLDEQLKYVASKSAIIKAIQDKYWMAKNASTTGEAYLNLNAELLQYFNQKRDEAKARMVTKNGVSNTPIVKPTLPTVQVNNGDTQKKIQDILASINLST